MAPRSEIVLASATLPLAYRLILTAVEPLFALMGAFMVLTKPKDYALSMSRHQSTAEVDISTQYLFTTLGGGWLYFAFVEAVVLRLFDDLRLWKILCAGMLLSDVAFGVSTVQAVGGWEVWADVSAWTSDDYIMLVTTLPMIVVRILILLGIGFKRAGHSKSE